MWSYKLKNIKFYVPSKLIQYRYYSEAVKSNVLNHPENVVASFEVTEKIGNKVAATNNEPLSNVNEKLSSTDVKTKSFMVSKTISTAMASPVNSQSLSFDDIPGPISLQLISKFWGTIPIMGTELTVSIIQYLLSGGKFFWSVWKLYVIICLQLAGFHLWKFVATPAWKALVRNCDMIDSILDKHVQRLITTLSDRKGKDSNLHSVSLLEGLLLKEGIVAEDVMTVLLDMLLIGVNATAHTVAFILYHLAKNPRCQIKLYEEIKQLGEKIRQDDINKMKYLHSCIKESLRLDPPIPILSRLLNNDVVINHYFIPKGTHVLFATHLNSIREEYFEDALKFKPERWLSNELGGFGNDFQTFASMPFGHGPKACVAKRLVELQIAVLLVNITKKFKIEYNYGDIQSSNELLASPMKPLKFRFIPRV
ncbi:hypothetical protein NQ315_013197 [Exocentrus adspersus]|uniref:Cytochrome P450 n=1 Tax=Exocentrus adspersus TaxID=1586481 RepID=A0AAV8VDG2_9CUCU|nr:hypothetical protein NQ315_013197 [Exocentrus adspersus]